MQYHSFGPSYPSISKSFYRCSILGSFLFDSYQALRNEIGSSVDESSVQRFRFLGVNSSASFASSYTSCVLYRGPLYPSVNIRRVESNAANHLFLHFGNMKPDGEDQYSPPARQLGKISNASLELRMTWKFMRSLDCEEYCMSGG